MYKLQQRHFQFMWEFAGFIVLAHMLKMRTESFVICSEQRQIHQTDPRKWSHLLYVHRVVVHRPRAQES